jgi:hypothetical protein
MEFLFFSTSHCSFTFAKENSFQNFDYLLILIINFLALFIQLVADHDMSVVFKASKCLMTGGDTKASAHWDGIRYLNERDCGNAVSNLEVSEV